MSARYYLVESHGAYATSEGGIKERVRWIVAEEVEQGKPLVELCSCGNRETAGMIQFALLAWNTAAPPGWEGAHKP